MGSLSVINPLGVIADVVLGIYKERKVQQWAKLLFEIWFSATTSALFVCGSTLMATNSWARSVGAGMIMAAVSSAYLFRRSPLTKGMMIALPSEEADKELSTNLQVIEK